MHPRSPAQRRVHVLVKGRVQGVCYRASTQAEARRHALTGWVRNLADGRVELEAQGPPGAVAALLEWARGGPPRARVDDLTVRDVPARDDAHEFRVRR